MRDLETDSLGCVNVREQGPLSLEVRALVVPENHGEAVLESPEEVVHGGLDLPYNLSPASTTMLDCSFEDGVNDTNPWNKMVVVRYDHTWADACDRPCLDCKTGNENRMESETGSGFCPVLRA